VLLDDLLMVIEATAYRLSSLPGIDVVGCYRVNDRQSVAQAGLLAPDVVVVNIDQIVGSDAGLLGDLAALEPSVRIIALTSASDRSVAQDAGRRAVSAWIHKDDSLSVLTAMLQSIRRVQVRSALGRGSLLRVVADETDHGKT
jgi:DNA-binding NarL/FixJ family response regulator